MRCLLFSIILCSLLSGILTQPLALGAYSSDEGITSESEDNTYLPELTYRQNRDDTESLDSFMTAEPSSRVATPTPDDESDQNTTLNETLSGRGGLFNTSIFNASGKGSLFYLFFLVS